MRSEWTLFFAGVVAASAAALAGSAGTSRESLVPLMRAGEQQSRQLERLGAEVLPVDADEERRLGAAIAGRFEGRDSPEQDRLRALGRRLEGAGLAKRYAGRYRYFLVDSPEPGAAAAPGGNILVSRGLLERLEGNPDRVSFALAHEIGHAELGHTTDLIRYRAWLEKWELPGGGLAQGLRNFAAAPFSPGQELEADAFAVKLLQTLDLRASASIEVIEAIVPEDAPAAGGPLGVLQEGLQDYGRSHPGRRERVTALRAALGVWAGEAPLEARR